MKAVSYLFVIGFGIANLLNAAAADAPAAPASPNHPVQPRVHTMPPPTATTRVVQVIPSGTPASQAPGIDEVLAWDRADKEIIVTNGAASAMFVFNLTNISAQDITIFSAVGSCGCTDIRTPALPWKLEPNAVGQITANMTVAGKSGTIHKTVTINTDRGSKILTVKSIIHEAPLSPEMQAMNRSNNQQLALADRQAIFKNDCVKCHVEPTVGKMGKELFTTACGICHTAEHRASMVPDLMALGKETDATYWRNWVTYGKPGSLMPAFSHAEGGILSDEQITSLVEYLTATIPSKPATSKSASTTSDAPAAH